MLPYFSQHTQALKPQYSRLRVLLASSIVVSDIGCKLLLAICYSLLSLVMLLIALLCRVAGYPFVFALLPLLFRHAAARL